MSFHIGFNYGGHHHCHPHWHKPWVRPVVFHPAPIPVSRPFIAGPVVTTSYPVTPLSQRAVSFITGGVCAIITGVALIFLGVAFAPETAGASLALAVLGALSIIVGSGLSIYGRIHG